MNKKTLREKEVKKNTYKNKKKIAEKQDVNRERDKSIKEDINNKDLKEIEGIIKEYGISEVSNIKNVLEKMQERLEYYIKIVIQILQPEDFHSLHECNVFDEKEKSNIFEIYKNMMILHREILKSIILNEDKEMVATIHYVHSELKNIKPEILIIIKKMQDSWKKNISNGRVKYFG